MNAIIFILICESGPFNETKLDHSFQRGLFTGCLSKRNALTNNKERLALAGGTLDLIMQVSGQSFAVDEGVRRGSYQK
jgi:hypothetical protein